MKFSDNILLYTLTPLLILLTGAAYVRFMVLHDYIVTYEGQCDPQTESCFIGCEDEECKQTFYFTIVEKYAANLYEQCGNDISDCELANVCLPGEEESCSITYCTPSEETCSTKNDFIQSDNINQPQP